MQMVYPLKIYDQRDKKQRHRHEKHIMTNSKWKLSRFYQCGANSLKSKQDGKPNNIYSVSGLVQTTKENPYEKWKNLFKNMTHEK